MSEPSLLPTVRLPDCPRKATQATGLARSPGCYELAALCEGLQVEGMNIGLIIPQRSSYEAFLLELSRGCEGKVVVFLRDEHIAGVYSPEGAVAAGVHFESLPLPRGNHPVQHLRAAWALRRALRRHAIDVAHAHFAPAAFTLALARQGLRGIHCMATFQGLMGNQPKAPRLAAWAEAWAAQQMDCAWVLTSDDVHYLRGRVRSVRARERIAQQPGYGFGCRTDVFDPALFAESRKTALRAQLGMESGRKVLTFIGRQVAFKGFPCVVRAFRKLRAQGRAVDLVLLGLPDPLHPSGLTGEEQSYVQQDPHIHALGWQADVAQYLAITDLLVFPSEREGMPVNVMEAQCMGVPVLACAARGSRELVAPDHLVSGQDPEVWAQRIAQMLDHPAPPVDPQQLAQRRHVLSRSRYVHWQVGEYRRRSLL